MSVFKIACIPVYNEEKLIENVIKRCKLFVDEVIVCDDGSTDQTVINAKNAGAHVLTHKENFGKGEAMKTLFNYAKKSDADIMVTIDGDGQFLPEEIPKIIEPITKKQSDIVIGYRFDDSEEMPSYRKLGNKMLDKVTNLASDLPFRDTQGGFRAYSRKAFDSISFSTKGFGVDSEILIDASRKGLKISEEKIAVIYNTGEKTSTKGPLAHSSEVLGFLLESIAIHHPLRYLGIPGTILAIIGIVIGMFVLTIFNETRYFSVPFTLITIATLVIGTLLMLMSVVLYSITKSVRQKV
jgi:glycosyltransferase involved in cell wall biosynthesis